MAQENHITREDLDFLYGKIKIRYTWKLNEETKLHEFYLEVTKGEVKKIYTPNKYLQIVLEGCYEKIDETSFPYKKYLRSIRSKHSLTRFILDFNVEIRNYQQSKVDYDFNYILNDIDSTIEKLKFEYELKWYHKKWLPLLVSFIALIVSLGTFFKSSNNPENKTGDIVELLREAKKEDLRFLEKKILFKMDSIINIRLLRDDSVKKKRLNMQPK